MITLEELKEYLHNQYQEDEEDDAYEDVYKGLIEEGELEVTTGEASEILNGLDVDHVDERIEWFNVTYLDVNDLFLIANVDFYKQVCTNCGENLSYGEPEDWYYFNGVYEESYTHLSGNLNGSNIDEVLCAECYSKLSTILNL